ncbi:MAG: hypothetical protein K2G10_00415 [Alistipes sp.]|nr:hypothetical protein [Alistipes sp.]
MNFANTRKQRLLAGYAEQKQSQTPLKPRSIIHYSFLIIHYKRFPFRYSFQRLLPAPASGYRAFTSGALGVVGTEGGCWCSAPLAASNINAGDFWFHASNVNPLNNGNRAYALPVRCVQHLRLLFIFFPSEATSAERAGSKKSTAKRRFGSRDCEF